MGQVVSMSDTKIKMPFPDKGDFAESNLNVDDIKEHLLDWLIGCYDKGEIICNLLPAYMADIEERFSEKENPNLERTKEYLKEAFRKLENERIDTAVQKRTESNEDNKKKLNLDINFVDEALKDWTFKNINTPRSEFTGLRTRLTETFLERTPMDFRIKREESLWRKMEYQNSNVQFKDNIFSYTALPEPSTKTFLQEQLKEMLGKEFPIKWGRSYKEPQELASVKFDSRKGFAKQIKEQLQGEDSKAKKRKILESFFDGVDWFNELEDKFWKDKVGTVSNSDYLLNPFIIFTYDIKIEIKENDLLGKATIKAIPLEELVTYQPTRGETRREPTIEELLSPDKPSSLDNVGRDIKTDDLQIKNDLWKHLKNNMESLKRYIEEATA
tara:strand:+ start:22 stop:1176 length:1155 start_codon:yes stop_codon:yes gene_type:complete